MVLRRLRTSDDEVAAAERRLLATRRELVAQAARTREVMHRRLARPDALASAAGLGALYGLWVSRPAACAADAPRERPGTRTRIPGWLVRMILSMMVTRLVGASEEPAADCAGAGTPVTEP